MTSSPSHTVSLVGRLSFPSSGLLQFSPTIDPSSYPARQSPPQTTPRRKNAIIPPPHLDPTNAVVLPEAAGSTAREAAVDRQAHTARCETLGRLGAKRERVAKAGGPVRQWSVPENTLRRMGAQVGSHALREAETRGDYGQRKTPSHIPPVRHPRHESTSDTTDPRDRTGRFAPIEDAVVLRWDAHNCAVRACARVSAEYPDLPELSPLVIRLPFISNIPSPAFLISPSSTWSFGHGPIIEPLLEGNI